MTEPALPARAQVLWTPAGGDPPIMAFPAGQIDLLVTHLERRPVSGPMADITFLSCFHVIRRKSPALFSIMATTARAGGLAVVNLPHRLPGRGIMARLTLVRGGRMAGGFFPVPAVTRRTRGLAAAVIEFHRGPGDRLMAAIALHGHREMVPADPGSLPAIMTAPAGAGDFTVIEFQHRSPGLGHMTGLTALGSGDMGFRRAALPGIVADHTGFLRHGPVIEARRFPSRHGMAAGAFLCGLHMIGRLTGRQVPVVAIPTIADHELMVDGCNRLPRRGGVAGTALVTAGQVCRWFARAKRGVVAILAGPGRLRMGKTGRFPAFDTMTGPTIGGDRDVTITPAGYALPVVAIATRSTGLLMIESLQGLPGIGLVTGLAGITGRQVISRSAAALRIMTGPAGFFFDALVIELHPVPGRRRMAVFAGSLCRQVFFRYAPGLPAIMAIPAGPFHLLVVELRAGLPVLGIMAGLTAVTAGQVPGRLGTQVRAVMALPAGTADFTVCKFNVLPAVPTVAQIAGQRRLQVLGGHTRCGLTIMTVDTLALDLGMIDRNFRRPARNPVTGLAHPGGIEVTDGRRPARPGDKRLVASGTGFIHLSMFNAQDRLPVPVVMAGFADLGGLDVSGRTTGLSLAIVAGKTIRFDPLVINGDLIPGVADMAGPAVVAGRQMLFGQTAGPLAIVTLRTGSPCLFVIHGSRPPGSGQMALVALIGRGQMRCPFPGRRLAVVTALTDGGCAAVIHRGGNETPGPVTQVTAVGRRDMILRHTGRRFAIVTTGTVSRSLLVIQCHRLPVGGQVTLAAPIRRRKVSDRFSGNVDTIVAGDTRTAALAVVEAGRAPEPLDVTGGALVGTAQVSR